MSAAINEKGDRGKPPICNQPKLGISPHYPQQIPAPNKNTFVCANCIKKMSLKCITNKLDITSQLSSKKV